MPDRESDRDRDRDRKGDLRRIRCRISLSGIVVSEVEG